MPIYPERGIFDLTIGRTPDDGERGVEIREDDYDGPLDIGVRGAPLELEYAVEREGIPNSRGRGITVWDWEREMERGRAHGRPGRGRGVGRGVTKRRGPPEDGGKKNGNGNGNGK